MNLTQEEWRRVGELFHQALELNASARLPFLVEATHEAPNLRQELESLLASFEQSTDFLEKPAVAQFAASIDAHFKTPTYATGDSIGDFVVSRPLGTGAFATVYLAHQVSLNRSVALKISPDFGDEAKTMASLEHQHIVKVFSQTRDVSKNVRILCMQYVPGTSLLRILENHPEGTPLTGAELLQQIDQLAQGDTLFDPAALKDREQLQTFEALETACWIGLRLAEALSYAHECGVLHLDVKPGNILINSYGQPMLTDFNVAVRSRALLEKTQTILGGTIDYMAPEHARVFQMGVARGDMSTERIDERADIYSLGLVLREMLKKSGLLGTPEAKGMETILNRCLDENPRQRFSSAGELARSLEAFVELRSIEKGLPEAGPVSRLTLQHPTLAFTLFTLVPQILGSIINISYNYVRIVSELNPAQQSLFRSLCVIYNLAVYPLCVGLIIVLFAPVVRFLSKPQLAPDDMLSARKLRHQVLRLPWRVGAISALGWMPGSVFFPLTLDYLEGPLPPGVYGHFFISFTLSCLIAMTYSFLYVQFAALRVLYPRLCAGEMPIRDIAKKELGLLGPTVRMFHFSAGLVPLLGAALVVIAGPDRLDPAHYEIYRWLVSLLLLLATCGIFAAVRATQLLSRCLFALTGSG